MGRRIGALRIFSSILLAAVLVTVLSALLGMALGLWRFAVIDTGSMRPALNPGDVAVLTSERAALVKRGQIVAFHPPGKPHLTVIHRVYSVQHTRSGVVIRTKGDANDVPDPWHARILGNIIWREDFKVPTLGYLVVSSGRPLVRFALLVVIVTLAVSLLLGAIWRPAPRRGVRRGDGLVPRSS